MNTSQITKLESQLDTMPASIQTLNQVSNWMKMKKALKYMTKTKGKYAYTF